MPTPNVPDNTEFNKKYPEHAKMSGRKEEWDNLMMFCNHLKNTGLLNKIEYYEDEYEDERMTYRSLDPIKIVCDYFDIDYKKFMAEKEKMLDEIRQATNVS